jgi:hypothetical protein
MASEFDEALTQFLYEEALVLELHPAAFMRSGLRLDPEGVAEGGTADYSGFEARLIEYTPEGERLLRASGDGMSLDAAVNEAVDNFTVVHDRAAVYLGRGSIPNRRQSGALYVYTGGTGSGGRGSYAVIEPDGVVFMFDTDEQLVTKLIEDHGASPKTADDTLAMVRSMPPGVYEVDMPTRTLGELSAPKRSRLKKKVREYFAREFSAEGAPKFAAKFFPSARGRR